MNESKDQLRETVRHKYADIARNAAPNCGPSCCSGGKSDNGYSMIGDAYEGADGYVAEADLGLGCGLPVEHAGLQPGQTVLDLGSGAGLDAFIARRIVGAEGRVIGVDMTAEMIARARQNAQNSGFDNVEFRLGEIEYLPILSDSVDVVISNCVLNLVPDKAQAFREIYRVLKPGGRFCISDVVASQELPDWVSDIAEAYAGCVSGAVPREAYLELIRATGFSQVEIATEKRIDVPAELLARSLTTEQRAEAERTDMHVLSITVTATKPAVG